MLVVVRTKEVFKDHATLTVDEFTQDHYLPVCLHFDLVISGSYVSYSELFIASRCCD